MHSAFTISVDSLNFVLTVSNALGLVLSTLRRICVIVRLKIPTEHSRTRRLDQLSQYPQGVLNVPLFVIRKMIFWSSRFIASETLRGVFLVSNTGLSLLRVHGRRQHWRRLLCIASAAVGRGCLFKFNYLLKEIRGAGCSFPMWLPMRSPKRLERKGVRGGLGALRLMIFWRSRGEARTQPGRAPLELPGPICEKNLGLESPSKWERAVGIAWQRLAM